MRGVNGPAALELLSFSGGCNLGAWGNVAYGGNVNPPCYRKGKTGNSPPKVERAAYLPDPENMILERYRIFWATRTSEQQ